MHAIWSLALFSLLFVSVSALAKAEIYEYIVVGSGPGGGPLAANLAKAGYSVLLLEAGDDQGENLHEAVGQFFSQAFEDPLMRWDFFVKYHTDDAITKQYDHLVYKTTDGQFYVGTDPPAGAKMLGVFYPRAGTLGGCSSHNAMCAILPSDSDWNYIANITGDESWKAENMLKHFVTLENNQYLPPGTPGHGFDGFLDICLNNDESLKNQTSLQIVLREAATAFGQDPDKIFDYIQRDLNNGATSGHDFETGIFGFPAHRSPTGRRVSARDAVLNVANAKNADGTKKYNLTVKYTSLATKVLFDSSKHAGPPQAIGVEMLVGKSLYSADPRFNASVKGEKKEAYASKEVILAGGVFNTPQLLKLSGIGPKDELKKFNISVLVDLPGVGVNLQDNNEFAVVTQSTGEWINESPVCTNGDPGDPCLEAWYQGVGPYAQGPPDMFMYKTKNSFRGERDIFMWVASSAYRGYWPGPSVNVVPADPANTTTIQMVKMYPQTSSGTVLLQSNDPQDVPDINFRFYEGDAQKVEEDLEALVEAVDFARGIFSSVKGPLAPLVENLPCDAKQDCDVKETIKVQSWSHHATSTCAIGSDNDPLAVLDSKFRVRGTVGLRVVDGSAFPKTPGSFPVIPTFMLAEKGTEVILQDN